MFKPLLCLSPLLLIGVLLQDVAPSTPIPAADAAMTNPVTPTAASLDHARKVYAFDCALCHGAHGDGKGEMAADLKLTMKDYTDPNTLKGRTDGELFYIIKNGRGQMPSEGDRQKPEVMWNMVTLVRSFAKK